MRGTMIIFKHDTIRAEVREFYRTPELEELRDVVGGDIEVVPAFKSIVYQDKVVRCVAFCNEHGKIENLPINRMATIAWAKAAVREGENLMNERGEPKDWLAGNVAILFGDPEFMSEL